MKALLPLLALAVFIPLAEAGVREVSTPAELKDALRAPVQGMTIRIGPGEYPGGWNVSGVSGLTLEARDSKARPIFRGGGTAWHFSRCENLTLRGLVFVRQSQNGVNIDDGGQRGKPVRGLTIEDVEVREVGPRGNCDGIKLSGVEDFAIRRCVLEGWGGQGIDMVGCHRGLVSESAFLGKDGFSATAGVQIKGGSSEVAVERCQFRKAGERPLNLGGSTGKEFFRPPDANCEARSLSVRDCLIEGSACAAAFVGLDGGEFSGNTIIFPEKWVFRILQETPADGFAPCRNVRVHDNRIIFRRSAVRSEVNIGPETAAETFTFTKNQWFAEDQPAASRPQLPVSEKDGIYGIDFRSPGRL